MYLFFDTETTGLPLNWNAPITNLSNWPRMVQLAWMLFDSVGNKIDNNSYIIKPEGFTIPIEVSRIHGITTQKAIEEGVSLKVVLDEFYELINEAEYLVAHNISFDEKIVGAEFLRHKYNNPIPQKKKICTMKSSVDYCGLKGPYGNKWPKLSELHYKLFNTDFDDAHDAMVDISITAKCFWQLKKLNLI